MHTHIHAHTHMHVHTHTYAHAHTHKHPYTPMHTPTPTDVYKHTYMYTHTHTHTPVFSSSVVYTDFCLMYSISGFHWQSWPTYSAVVANDTVRDFCLGLDRRSSANHDVLSQMDTTETKTDRMSTQTY